MISQSSPTAVCTECLASAGICELRRRGKASSAWSLAIMRGHRDSCRRNLYQSTSRRRASEIRNRPQLAIAESAVHVPREGARVEFRIALVFQIQGQFVRARSSLDGLFSSLTQAKVP